MGKNDELTELEIAKEVIGKITNSFQVFMVFIKIGKAKIVTALLKMTNVILIILNLRLKNIGGNIKVHSKCNITTYRFFCLIH